MKNINFLFLSIIILFTACKKNEDITVKTEKLPKSIQVVTIKLEGFVKAEATILENVNTIYNSIYPSAISNAIVNLVYDNEVLATAYTNGSGYFAFEEQAIPLEGALLKIEANNYFPNARKINIDTSANSDFLREYIDLLPIGYGDFFEEGISSNAPKINITGWLLNTISGTSSAGMTMYVKNSSGHLVGNYHTTGQDPFVITTLANEKLFLYYQTYCQLSEPISIGPFAEDTDLGTINFEETYTDKFTKLTSIVTDCSGTPINAYLSARLGNHTTQSQLHYTLGNSTQAAFAFDCQVENVTEFTVTAYNADNFESFGEASLAYTPGQDLMVDIELCTPNETYFKYKVGGDPETIVPSFSFANVNTGGDAVIEIESINYKRIKLGVMGTAIGDHVGEILFRDGSATELTGVSLTVSITQNDGEYIEGTLSGSALDPLESPLGLLTGSFKAKIR